MLVTVLGILSSCSTTKITTTSKNSAIELESNGNYAQAVDAWKKYFSDTPVEQIAGSDFAKAAKAAFKTNNSAQSKSWFDQA
ncbi:MAG: hypothetical protein ACK5M7_13725 [Draconibacterium sp.]